MVSQILSRTDFAHQGTKQRPLLILCDTLRPVIKEHDRVILTEALLTHGLEPGDIGAVVHVYADGEAFEVEFVTLDGHTAAVCTVESSQVRPASSREIPHARELVAR
jgi:hypothetical protein